MKIAIVYDTATGRTQAAAKAMAETLTEKGHECAVQSIYAADPAEVARADLICTGCWTHGLFVILQHPTKDWVHFMERFGDLSGKKLVLFCTYRLATGRTLKKMARVIEEKGGEVIGRFEFRGPEPNAAFTAFAAGL